MMKFLKILALLGLATLISTPVIRAQDQTPPAEGKKGGGRGRGQMSPDAMVARLDEAVTLTADQKAKVKDIYTKLMADMQALPQEDRRTKGGELRTAANKDIRALLTPEQQKKFDEMPQGRGPGGGGRKKQN